MDKFNFDAVRKRFEGLKNTLPTIIAEDTKNYFVNNNFNAQQFDGVGWQKRKGKDTGRALLVKSGRLRRDLINSLKSATWEMIRFEVNNEYGAYHNEGIGKMPKRQFMGQSKELTKRQTDKMKSKISNIWQG